MNAMGHVVRPSGMLKHGLQLIAVAATAFSVVAETTNDPAITNAPAATAAAPLVTETAPRPREAAPASASSPRRLDESSFRIVAERNIFNANRSGGQVRLSSSRRPARVESFTLVGTMAYEKGAFAFFEGSSSEFAKAVKTGGVIAGYKVVDVLANAVKLEADGKILELPIGSAMRREDEGAWHLGDGVADSGGSSYVSTRESSPSSRSSRSDSGGRSSRSSRRDSVSAGGHESESVTKSTTANSNSSADQSEILKLEKQDKKDSKKESKLDSKMESEILKRLMERREKESQ
ncbi:MAG: hypothetical protein MUF81_05775 [Verrucomicrobia bacterium]|nr:hypothetical protein [Verrucomicrobiota bacterium]